MSNAFQESFANGIGVWSRNRCFENFNARFCGNARELLTKFTVIIANETLRLLVKRSSFTQLLSDPIIRWRIGYAKMDNTPRGQINNEKHVILFKKQVKYRQKVASPDVGCVVLDKGCPVLTGRSVGSYLSNIFLDRPFTDVNIGFEQLAADPFCAP